MKGVSEQALAATVPPSVMQLCEKLGAAGYGAWCVGGAIRDAILKQWDATRTCAIGDWDIASSATPEQVGALFRRVIPSGIKHGTVTVLLQDRSVEVTTLRGEKGFSDGRRPDTVFFVDDIREDLARRDFTVNAIAFDPTSKAVLDPFRGLEDLDRKVLRAVGNPTERFLEDGLRVLRAARFAATLDFDVEAETRAAMRPSLGSYAKVSAERIREEWVKALKAPSPSRAFGIMLEQGLLEITAPELAQMYQCEQNRYHRFDVWEHTMRTLDEVDVTSLPLRLAALFHDVGKPSSRALNPSTGDFTFHDHEIKGAQITDAAMRRLKFPNDMREHVVALVRHHLVVYSEDWTDSAVRRWLTRVTPNRYEEVLELARADVLAKGTNADSQLRDLAALASRIREMLASKQALSLRDLAITGNQLIDALSISPGPIVGRVLHALLDEVLEAPERNERERLLDRARELHKSFS